MIISASRRTDIPGLFSEWFYNRLQAGYVLLRNPYNPLQVGRVTLSPDKVDGFVFWTKNAAPMLKRLRELDDYKYYFQFTITPYGKDVEKNIPDKKEVIIPAFKKIGMGKTVWRYDPIFINDIYTVKYHISKFKEIAQSLEGYTDKAVMSFIDFYKTVNLKPINIQVLDHSQQNELAEELSEIAASHGITLSSCAENLNLPHSACIDGKMFGINEIKDANQRGMCQCVKSVDIGAYSTCSNGCQYCYANRWGYVQPPPDVHAEILGEPLHGNEKIKQRN